MTVCICSRPVVDTASANRRKTASVASAGAGGNCSACGGGCLRGCLRTELHCLAAEPGIRGQHGRLNAKEKEDGREVRNMSVTNLDLKNSGNLNRIAMALEKIAKALESLAPDTNTETK